MKDLTKSLSSHFFPLDKEDRPRSWYKEDFEEELREWALENQTIVLDRDQVQAMLGTFLENLDMCYLEREKRQEILEETSKSMLDSIALHGGITATMGAECWGYREKKEEEKS